MSEANDPRTAELLEAALGSRVVVRKQRELWRKDNVSNLDTVEGVGRVLEVEVQVKDGYDIDAQVNEYRRLFSPCLGGNISGSDEDLVMASKRPAV